MLKVPFRTHVDSEFDKQAVEEEDEKDEKAATKEDDKYVAKVGGYTSAGCAAGAGLLAYAASGSLTVAFLFAGFYGGIPAVCTAAAIGIGHWIDRPFKLESEKPSPSQSYPTSGLRFRRMGLLLLPRHRL